MQIAHIILVHKDPLQVMRMIKSCTHSNIDFWIHVDAKCNANDFEEVLNLENVYTVQPRVKVQWGGYSIVQATLNVLHAAIRSGKKYSYFNFLSGQDYPIKRAAEFYTFLQQNTGVEFAGSIAYNTRKEDAVRITSYYLHEYNFPGKLLAERIMNRFLPARQFPFNYAIRKGNQWITITNAAVNYILDFLKANPEYAKYFRLTHAPDEFFFQTILYNSHFKEKIKDVCLQYIDWSENKKSPKTLTIQDSENLLQSPLFFARKFDSKVDENILNLLDKQVVC